jgi:hypothetical protein
MTAAAISERYSITQQNDQQWPPMSILIADVIFSSSVNKKQPVGSSLKGEFRNFFL